MFVCLLKEGDRVRAGEREATLVSIPRYGVGLLKLDDGAEVLVSWTMRVLLFPEVEVTVARRSGQGARLKLLIDAPRHIELERLYGSPDGHPSLTGSD